MNERFLIVIMMGLGFGISVITPASSVSTGAAKGLAWFISGILSKFFK